jgi:hypothetical protein
VIQAYSSALSHFPVSEIEGDVFSQDLELASIDVQALQILAWLEHVERYVRVLMWKWWKGQDP